MAVRSTCIALLVLAAGLAGAASAQPHPPGSPAALRFEHLTVDQGLSQTSIREIFQDSQGFLWFGTGDGLNRYDGYEVEVYKHDPDDPNSLAANGISALYEAPSEPGVLWVGSPGTGLTRFDRRRGAFTRYRHDPDDPASLRSDVIMALFEDHSGTFWVGTDAGLHRMDRATGAFTHYEHELENAGSLSANGVTAIGEDARGDLWVGTWGGGLNRFDRETDAFTHFRHDPANPRSLGDSLVTTLYDDGRGGLWVGTWGGGLSRFDPQTQAFTRHTHDADDPNSLGDDRVTAIGAVPAEPGVLWVGTWNGGINRLDVDAGTVTRHRHDPSDDESLPADRVTALLGDRSGVLWVGTDFAGAGRANVATGAFTLYRHDPDRPHSLSDNMVWSVYEDRDGMLWVGTHRGGLNRIDRRRGTATHFGHDADDPRSISHDMVRAILEDRDGILWFGSPGGLDRFDPATGGFRRYDAFPEIKGHSAVVALLEDRAGDLWAGLVGGGLVRIDRRRDAPGSSLSPRRRGSGQAVTRYLHDPDDRHSLSSDHVTALYEARDGTLWVGTWDGGLNRFDRDNETFTRYRHEPGNADGLSHNTILTLHEDAAGALWIGTYAGGLNCFHPDTGTFVHFTEQNSDLPTNTINGILADDAGRLWLSTHNGLSRFDPERKTFRNYGVERGLQSREFNTGAYHKGRSGELFFGGINGLNAFFPDAITDNPSPPEVVLTGLRIRNESVEPGAAGSPLEVPLSMAAALTLPHAENDLSFEYVGLHYAAPAHNRYAYKLEGFDADWRWVGTQRSATYTNLPPGDFVFRVKAANSDGVWAEEGAAIPVTIRPPWWRTGWAYALYALLLVAGVFVVDRVQRRRLIGKERERAKIREVQLQARAAEAQAQLLRVENERQLRELEEARQLQLSMLPDTVPDHPVVDVAAYMKTATEVGGDYYDFDVDVDGTLTLAIGDATGHGANAGTMVTAAKSLFNVLACEPDLVDILNRYTRALKRMSLPRLYMALAMGRLRGRTLELAGAGMPPALVYRAATGQVEEIPLKGMPLGSFVDYPYQQAATTLDPGDTVLLMSDGFPEMFNGDGDMFGYDRARLVFKEVAGRSPDAIVAHFAEAGRRFANGSNHRDDDMTFVVLKVKPYES